MDGSLRLYYKFTAEPWATQFFNPHNAMPAWYWLWTYVCPSQAGFIKTADQINLNFDRGHSPLNQHRVIWEV